MNTNELNKLVQRVQETSRSLKVIQTSSNDLLTDKTLPEDVRAFLYKNRYQAILAHHEALNALSSWADSEIRNTCLSNTEEPMWLKAVHDDLELDNGNGMR